jgi:hypothetical protein
VLLTIRTTHAPATDLGYLLFKHPERVQHFELSFDSAHVFYPEVSEEACTAALLLDVDPVGLVRGRGGAARGGSMDQYVNDRPYVASSFLASRSRRRSAPTPPKWERHALLFRPGANFPERAGPRARTGPALKYCPTATYASSRGRTRTGDTLINSLFFRDS